MKKITLLALGLCVSGITLGQQTITHSTDPTTVTPAITVACPTEPTNYQRTFDFANQFDITDDFEITEVEFGVEVSETSQEVTLRLAIIDNVDPSEDTDADGVPDFNVLETLFEGPVAATTADEGTVVGFTLPEAVTVPAGGILLFELAETIDGIVFRIGANQAGETAESYLFSTGCGFGSVNSFGFDNDYVMNIIGDTVLSVNDTQLAEAISLFPNPTNGDLNIDFARNLGEVSVNLINVSGQVLLNTKLEGVSSNVLPTSSLATGVYFAQIATEQGSTTIKFVKN